MVPPPPALNVYGTFQNDLEQVMIVEKQLWQKNGEEN